jgi:type II secretory pathway pseudopilin PulG
LFGLVLAFLGTFYGGYTKGEQAENERQQLEIARLNAEARQKEQALAAAVTTTATQLVKVNNDAKKETYKRDLAIASGALRLRIPVKTPECPVSASADTAPAPRDSVQTTAELDPTIARSLVAITDQGDANTRQLNACIDAYNEVRNRIAK